MTEILGGDNARSAAGHAAFSMRGLDDRWVTIQMNTFCNWVNEQVRSKGLKVEDFQTDFCDGILLCNLLEVLQGKRVGRFIKKPMNQHQYLENVTLSLQAMQRDNIKLVNIGSEDIVNGNLKLILGLIWHMILRYQIGKASKIPPKKLMLSWLNAILYPDNLSVSNFNSDWNDGIALHAIIEYCRPGSCPNWRSLRRSDNLENCRDAMNLAKKHFDIPLVLSPENLSSPDLDELSGMTYLSYFMKVDSPGYHATLSWVNKTIPDSDVRDFQNTWNDGQVLASLIEALGGNVNISNSHDHVRTLQECMDSAKRMGVEPVIPAKEMADTEVDHLGVMAYAAWFQNTSGHSSTPSPPPPPAPPVAFTAPPPPPPPPVIERPRTPSPPPLPPPEKRLMLTQFMRETIPANITTFTVEMMDDQVNKNNVHVEVMGPASKPPVTLSWHGTTGHGHFAPIEPGNHQLMIYHDGVLISGCPKEVVVTGPPPPPKPQPVSINLLTRPPAFNPLGIAMPLRINASQAGNVHVEARSPSGRMQDMSVQENGGVFTANFTPTEVGDWMISILYEGVNIQGSPFNVRVYDAAQVKVFGLEGGSVGKTFAFRVDCSEAGDGELLIDIKHNGITIPADVVEDGISRGCYRVAFTPEGAGIYTIVVRFAGVEVTGSPYTLEIVDSSKVTASGEGISGPVEVGKITSFIVDTHGASGGNIDVKVTSPQRHHVNANVRQLAKDQYRVEYMPAEVGEHTVSILYYGKPIHGSPHQVQSIDWSRITLRNLRPSGVVGRLVEFDIDTANAGSGNLEIMVNDGTIPCSVQNRGNRQFHASFTPKDASPHYIQMKFNGREVPGSPWRVDIRGATSVTVKGAGLTLAQVNRHSMIELVASGGYSEGNVEAHAQGPSGRPVPVNVSHTGGGHYLIDYVPYEVGTHQINVMFDGQIVNGSPFTVKSYDASSIHVSEIQAGSIGRPVEFTIDVTQAGEGQLEIMVNQGAVPNTVKMLRKGVFLVSFVPRDPNPHSVDIRFNQEPLPICPITVPVLDASRVTVQGGLENVAVNRYSSFRVNTASAGEADLNVRVTSPSGKNVPIKLTANSQYGFDGEYRLSEVGTHQLDVKFGGLPVTGSPFYIKAYDADRVGVQGVQDGIVGQKSEFTVDVTQAGEGNLEISIVGGGRNIQNHVRQIGPGKFEVSYNPQEGIDHQAMVTFNGEHVRGSPFPFQVTDIGKVCASGDGLTSVPVGRPAQFIITGPGIRGADFDIRVNAPDRKLCQHRLTDKPNGQVAGEYTPKVVGDHMVEILYQGVPINGSPFKTRVWDARNVFVSNLNQGRIKKPNNFNVDASQAGAGNLEIVVTVAGETLPNFVKSQGNANFEVSFTPKIADTHMISIKFNGETIPGSPFYCSVIDGSKVTASGDGLGAVPASKPTHFMVHTSAVGPADITVDITSPDRAQIPVNISGTWERDFHVAYTPTVVGPHLITIKYADIDIAGSPFTPQVYDANAVKVSNIPQGIIDQPVTFEVDCSRAGEGTMKVDIRGRSTSPHPEIVSLGNGLFEVTFIPKESVPHTIMITYNNQKVPGSSFKTQVVDLACMSINWEQLNIAPVNRSVPFDLQTGGVMDVPVEIFVNDPHGHNLPVHMVPAVNKYRIDFKPTAVGPHIITVTAGGMMLKGSPHTLHVYDTSRVYLDNVTMKGKIGEEMGFTVDTTEAGQGDIDIEIMRADGQPVRPVHHPINNTHHHFSFIPQVAMEHIINVMFNNEQVPGVPLTVQVTDPFAVLVMRDAKEFVLIDDTASFIIGTQGARIDPNDLLIQIQAPNGDRVPAKLKQQPDGDYKVEYSSKYTGRHTVEILYAGQAIMGSPFYVEIYDPNKIRVEGMKGGLVGEKITFEIIRNEAGKAELSVSIHSPSGRTVPFDMSVTGRGERVTYVPEEVGPHQIYIHYGGLEVPGCPMNQVVQDGGTAFARGEGLHRGEEDKPAAFVIDTKGKHGDLSVVVEGPNSMAKCNIEPDHTGGYIVTYIPVEVGTFNIRVKWNNREIQGSPFQARVVDSRKVRPVGEWSDYVDANNNMALMLNETKIIRLDATEAGPGEVSAELRGPAGMIPVNVFSNSRNMWTVEFTPKQEGEYHLHLKYADVNLPRSPFRGSVKTSMPPPPAPSQSINHDKVVLTGRGLQEAKVNEEAEFVIDGTLAGPGNPTVKLTGIKCDIETMCQPLGGNKYRVTYVPKLPGAYLLTIMWSDRQVQGSPFKVNVPSHSDATKVICTGDGLKAGIMGREIKSIIDTRRAGPGELTAHCAGPHKIAYCELFDHRDGTFTLNVQPQEAGRHVLNIKFDGEHVTGSPYILRVSGAPDASKVRVYGPGVEHGILAQYQSRFIVDTRGAGAGQLTVRIRGPKGAFRVEMQRESQKDRTILCRYDPCEIGDYVVHVKWSGEHVPSSPFHVHICDTQEELERVAQDNGPSGFRQGFGGDRRGDMSTMGSSRIGEASMNFNTWQH